jgi:PIN domain nuclease of toxin-antitoxin system
VNLLVDTHLLLWAAGAPDRLSATARALLADRGNTLYFSAASLWEIAIKSHLGRDDLRVDARLLRRGLLDNDWHELAITGVHALATGRLPLLHRDPFDRMLLAQADSEGLLLVTADTALAGYPCPVRLV